MEKETVKTIALIILVLAIMGTVGYLWFKNFKAEAIAQGFTQGSQEIIIAIAQTIQQNQIVTFPVGDMNIVCAEQQQ